MSINSNPLNHDRRIIFYPLQLNDAFELAADENTEVPMHPVCYRSSQNVTNCRYFQLMFRSTNWNVQRIDWLAGNCNRWIVANDAIGLFAAVAVAADRIKYPKKCPMNLRKIVARERTAAETALEIVAVMKMMIKDQMKKLNSKNSAGKMNKRMEN